MRADLGFPCLLRETLSKNAVLSGLTYSYCNSVSQAGGVAGSGSVSFSTGDRLC